MRPALPPRVPARRDRLPELERALDQLEAGDVLVVTKLD
jgi:DNA invertase Pin-like site-specific DNA recombinase